MFLYEISERLSYYQIQNMERRGQGVLENLYFGAESQEENMGFIHNDKIKITQGCQELDIWKKQIQPEAEAVIYEDDFWRTNNFLDIQSNNPFKTSDMLCNVTSFVENAMEDHGKRLCESYLSYFSPENQSDCTLKASISYTAMLPDENAFIAKIISSTKLKQWAKQFLISEIKRSLDCKQLLLQLINGIPENIREGAFLLAYELLKTYNQRDLEELKANQVFTYVQNNLISYSKRIQPIMSRHVGQPRLENFDSFLKTWMQSIFLGLKGIFAPQKRQRLSEFSDEDEDWGKRIKID